MSDTQTDTQTLGLDLSRLISSAQATTQAVNNLNQTVAGASAQIASIVLGIPTGAVALSKSSGNVGNATAAATLTGTATTTVYISGFVVQSGGATTAAIKSLTVTGLLGGTLTFTYATAVGATVMNADLIITFPAPLPASAINTTIVVSLAALGSGNTNATVNAFGFYI